MDVLFIHATAPQAGLQPAVAQVKSTTVIQNVGRIVCILHAIKLKWVSMEFRHMEFRYGCPFISPVKSCSDRTLPARWLNQSVERCRLEEKSTISPTLYLLASTASRNALATKCLKNSGIINDSPAIIPALTTLKPV